MSPPEREWPSAANRRPLEDQPAQAIRPPVYAHPAVMTVDLLDTRVAAMERLLGLLAKHLGVDLDQLDVVDRVNRRGYPITGPSTTPSTSRWRTHEP